MDSVRLPTWFLLTTDEPSATLTHSVGEVLADIMQLRAEVLSNDITPGHESPPIFMPVASLVLTSGSGLQAYTPLP